MGYPEMETLFLIQPVEVFIRTYECKTMNDTPYRTCVMSPFLLFFLRVGKKGIPYLYAGLSPLTHRLLNRMLNFLSYYSFRVNMDIH